LCKGVIAWIDTELKGGFNLVETFDW
jgi:hypothetical protein